MTKDYTRSELRQVLNKPSFAALSEHEWDIVNYFEGNYFAHVIAADVEFKWPKLADVHKLWLEKKDKLDEARKKRQETPSPVAGNTVGPQPDKSEKAEAVKNAALASGHLTHTAGLISAAIINDDPEKADAKIGELVAGEGSARAEVDRANNLVGCMGVAVTVGALAVVGWVVTQGLRTGADKGRKLQRAVEVREEEMKKAQGIRPDGEEAKPIQQVQPVPPAQQGMGR